MNEQAGTNSVENSDTSQCSFREFQLFYESAEKVTDRRLAANTWNYSICVATLGAIFAVLNWGMARSGYQLTSVLAVMVLAGMAALFCSLWIGQIRDLKELNNAKFGVLNEMAPKLHFGKDDPSVSYRPFEKEWDRLKDARATEEVRSMNLIALKSSNIEYLIPKAFRVLFLAIILLVVAQAAGSYLAGKASPPTEPLGASDPARAAEPSGSEPNPGSGAATP